MKKNIFVIAIVFLLLVVLIGCSRNANIRVEGETWAYDKLNRGRDGIALLRLNCDSVLTEEGVLYIPTEVDGYTVAKLTGSVGRGNWWHSGITHHFNARNSSKIVIPEGVAVDRLFWGDNIPLYIEFLAKMPDERSILFGVWRDFKLIVPDGSREIYIKRLYQERSDFPLGFIVIERSDFLLNV